MQEELAVLRREVHLHRKETRRLLDLIQELRERQDIAQERWCMEATYARDMERTVKFKPSGPFYRNVAPFDMGYQAFQHLMR